MCENCLSEIAFRRPHLFLSPYPTIEFRLSLYSEYMFHNHCQQCKILRVKVICNLPRNVKNLLPCLKFASRIEVVEQIGDG